ncbi:MAG TPA: type II CAAX endopeptidase family protein [Thermoanaerobaculia bacterium]|nr:type II CAAX endopeptidase family protein [Thermoanaerobaculia bacterium]
MIPSEPSLPDRSPVRRGLALLVPALRAILYLIAYIAAQYAVVLPLRAFGQIADPRFFAKGGFGRSNEVFLVVILLAFPLQILVTWPFAKYLDRRSLASLGARAPVGGRRAALRQSIVAPLGAVGVLGVWLASILVLPAAWAAVRFGGISPDFTHPPAWWPFSPWLLLLALLVGFLLQGGLEEWIVRGYVYHTLRERWRPWIAALGSSLLFGLLHAGNPNVSAWALLNVVLAGMVLAGLVERTASLWSATLAHGAWNFAVACLLSVPVSGVRLFHLFDVTIDGSPGLTGGGFGPEGSWLLTLIGIPLTAAVWWGIWRRPSDRGLNRAAASASEDIPLPADA